MDQLFHVILFDGDINVDVAADGLIHRAEAWCPALDKYLDVSLEIDRHPKVILMIQAKLQQALEELKAG